MQFNRLYAYNTYVMSAFTFYGAYIKFDKIRG